MTRSGRRSLVAGPGPLHDRDMERLAPLSPILLTPDAIERVPALPLGPLQGVTHRVLWSANGSMAGVLTVNGGCRLGSHTHRVNHHHLWVLDGEAEILGTTVGAGTYVHVPSGIEHDIDASDSGGCSVFYLYLHPAT